MGFFNNVGGSLSDLIKNKFEIDSRFAGDPQIWINGEKYDVQYNSDIFTVRGFSYDDGQFSENRVSAMPFPRKVRMTLRFSYRDVVDAIFKSIPDSMRHVLNFEEILRIEVVPEFDRNYSAKLSVVMKCNSKYFNTLHRESFPIYITDIKWKTMVMQFEAECHMREDVKDVVAEKYRGYRFVNKYDSDIEQLF